MTGFIDGTANPKDTEAIEAALIPQDKENAGGAYVLSMQYVHDLDAFNKLPVSEQENVIGRTKPDSTELDPDLKPKDAHIARAEISEDGVELKIYRRSFPYGGVQQHGLYFLAFACDQHRFDAMLKSMYGLAGDGVHDRLLLFTRAVTASYWFAPSQETLETMLR
jgi:putative iron-dependent peroxidase